jgi:hypothetical protein
VDDEAPAAGDDERDHLGDVVRRDLDLAVELLHALPGLARDNRARIANPAYRLVTVVLIRARLRVSNALRLSRDCVVLDCEGALSAVCQPQDAPPGGWSRSTSTCTP